MQRFWYHSPVRFYRTLEELEDMTNPQNTAYFGKRSPFKLEKTYFHRYLIPNYDNDITPQDLFLYVVNEMGEQKITLVSEIIDNKLKYVTIFSSYAIRGRLEIRTASSEVLFYSNEVEFVDSEDCMGRKFVRIATRHLYNRHLFDFDDTRNWIITSIPAYCLGMTDVEADISNVRVGGNSTLRTRETYIDEVVEYEVIANGDANVLNFLQVHSTNNQFFIDGTQRTPMEMVDREEMSMSGTMRFTNVKDKVTGLNVTLEYNDVLNNIFTHVLGTEDLTMVSYENNLIPTE